MVISHDQHRAQQYPLALPTELLSGTFAGGRPTQMCRTLELASDSDTSECDTAAGAAVTLHTETSLNADSIDSTEHSLNGELGPQQRADQQPDTALDWEEFTTLLSASSRTEWRGKRLFVGSTEAKVCGYAQQVSQHITEDSALLHILVGAEYHS
eukprot:910376-Rhodomonas_salina.1